jgi:hypothetical protein
VASGPKSLAASPYAAEPEGVWSTWLVIECVIGAAAAILVWMLIVAIVVTHLEERHHGPAQAAHHRARHGHGR